MLNRVKKSRNTWSISPHNSSEDIFPREHGQTLLSRMQRSPFLLQNWSHILSPTGQWKCMPSNQYVSLPILLYPSWNLVPSASQRVPRTIMRVPRAIMRRVDGRVGEANTLSSKLLLPYQIWLFLQRRWQLGDKAVASASTQNFCHSSLKRQWRQPHTFCLAYSRHISVDLSHTLLQQCLSFKGPLFIERVSSMKNQVL